jgi:class 3 adenylate cyclase/tetratricopeptide (TPR) repeat protein
VNIEAWLASLGLERYRRAFDEHAIDAEVLPELSDEDLKEMGVLAVGHRRKILTAIRALTETPGPTGSNEEPQPLEAQGERRHVAVLFADLVGYTRLTEELGAEGMHDLLDQYFTWLDGLVEQAGGRVDKHIGDCVMGVFGAPVSHGNDAERAVRAAIEINKSLPAIRERLGYNIEVHVGLSIGIVVANYVGSGKSAEYAVTGDSVNLAARLSDAAAPGEVLISDGLYRALPGRLNCEPVGELSVKGLGAPVRAWRLLGLSEHSRSEEPFAGRRNELRQFETILDSCVRDGAGQAIILRGEAGIGKTRLTEELERMALDRGFAAHRGLVLDFGNETGRDALRVIVRDLVGLPARPSTDELCSASRKAIEAGIVDSEMAPHLNALLDAPQPDRLKSIYEAMDDERRISGRASVISQLLSWASRQEPRLLIVEDVHWARSPLLRGLSQLATAVAANSVVLALTTRPEGDPLNRTWRSSVEGTPFTTFDLSPLSKKDVHAICEALLGGETLSEELISRAGGNPLFLKQLLLHRDQDNSRGVPGTIQSLVQATIDKLEPNDKQLIQAASVIGQSVDPSLMEEAFGFKLADTNALVEQNLLRPRGQDYLFVHALIRDAVYESLLGSTRKELHRKAADWFANRDHRLYAEHLALAGSPKAASAFLMAAREEAAKHHFETAVSLVERGLALEPSRAERFDLEMLAGDAWHDFGRMSESGTAYGSALELASNPKERCRALIGQAGVKRVIEDNSGALADLIRAEAEAASENLLSERSQILFLRGNVLFPLGDIEGCLEAHRGALDLARQAKRLDLQAAALGGLGDAEYMRGHMSSSRQRLEECVALARRERLERTVAANEAQIAHTHIYTGPQNEAYAAACKAVEAARRIGHARAEVNARVAIIKALSSMGQHEECLAEVERCDPLIEHLGTTRFRQELYYLGSRALAGLGRREEALQRIAEGMAFAHRTGFSFSGPAVASTFAVLESDPEKRLKLLGEAEEGIAEGCVGHNQFRVYSDGIDVAFALKDAELLRRYLRLSEEYPPGEKITWSTFHAKRGRALLALLEEGLTEKPVAQLKSVQRDIEELQMWSWSVDDIIGA